MASSSKWEAVGGQGGTQAERFYRRYWQWLVETGYHRKPPPPRLHVALGLLERYAPPPGAGGRRLWVDAGCADGKLGRLVREAALGLHGVGADISSTALEMAVQHYERVVRWDATAESLTESIEPGSAAAVTCLDVLEHLFDPGEAVADFRRLLRPDGVLVVSTPNFVHWRSRLTVLRGAFPSDEQHIFHEADHLHYFTMRSFADLVRQAGFDVLTIEGTMFQLPRLLDGVDQRTGRRLGHRRPSLLARQLVLAARPSSSSS